MLEHIRIGSECTKEKFDGFCEFVEKMIINKKEKLKSAFLLCVWYVAVAKKG